MAIDVGLHSQKLSVAPSGARTIERNYWVDLDGDGDALLGPLAVEAAFTAATGVKRGVPYSHGTQPDPGAVPPVAGDPWAEADERLFCTNLELDQSDVLGDGDGLRWTVKATYQPWVADWAGAESPLDEPPEISFGFAQWERVCDRAFDADGEPVGVLNSAGDPFDPPVTADDSRPVITIQANRPSVDFLLAAQFKDAVNAGACEIGDVVFAPRTLKVANIQAARQFHQAVPGGFYWKLTIELHANEETWDRAILDAGLRRLDGSGNRADILFSGERASAPVPLDGAGAPLSPAADPVYLPFRVYKERDFAALGFPGP